MSIKLVFVFSFLKCVLCANILFIGGIASPSHHIFNRAPVFALADKGHNITFLENDVEKEKHKNVHSILLEGVYKGLQTDFVRNDMLKYNSFESVYNVYEFGDTLCLLYFKTKGLKQLIDYPDNFNFDLILIDNSLGECLYPLIDRFGKPPVVAITAFLLPPYLANAMGSHLYPSYYPHYGLQFTNKMTFFQRLHSFVLTYGDIIYRNYIFEKRQLKNMKSYFGENARSFLEYEKEIALLLSNTDPILDYPMPLQPNIIPIGGMHLKPAKPLPKDLEKIVNEAKHGVIFFSLGTNIQAHLLGTKMRDEFVAAFSKLKETVIWKYEAEIPNLPSNVITRKWLPQSDILGHPKCKLFISHGGGLSTQEAVYYGVPVVGIPGFVDQHKNVHGLVSKGFGVKLSFKDIDRRVVYEAVQEVLNNPKYSDKIKEASRKYRDQPQTPLERAIFWTEYVLRHKGADELNSPARDMWWYQTSNLDVILFIDVVLLCVLFLVYKILFRICCSFKREKVKKN